jgi:hypothetical protein
MMRNKKLIVEITVLIILILGVIGYVYLGKQEIPEPVVTLPTPHFGIAGIELDINAATELGIGWDKPHPGPFIWGQIEPERGRYEWQGVDEYVHKVQSYDIATLATIWPFAEWDQTNWGDVSDTLVFFEDDLGRGRRKPYDMQVYKRFVSALVERYDGDGKEDMPGLKYPIKYWEASNEPSMQTFFDGSPEDYLELLKATYEAVKEADPGAKVLHAGLAGTEPAMVSFWEPIFKKGGGQYFDIAAIHCFPYSDIAANAQVCVPEFKKLLSKYGIDKPIWVTDMQYKMGETPGKIFGIILGTQYISPEEHARIFVKSYVTSFAWGAKKIFYTCLRAQSHHPPAFKQAALIDENGEIRPAYHALKTLIWKLDKFTSVEKLAEGQYKFIVEERAIYVLWDSGEIPEEIAGGVLVTDIYGNETKMPASTLKVTESPVFVKSESD